MDFAAITTAVNQAALAAQAGSEPVAQATEKLGPGIAIGLSLLAAGLGIGKLASTALEGAARQPEAAGKLQNMMILAIAFIEALALIALIFSSLVI